MAFTANSAGKVQSPAQSERSNYSGSKKSKALGKSKLKDATVKQTAEFLADQLLNGLQHPKTFSLEELRFIKKRLLNNRNLIMESVLRGVDELFGNGLFVSMAMSAHLKDGDRIVFSMHSDGPRISVQSGDFAESWTPREQRTAADTAATNMLKAAEMVNAELEERLKNESAA